MLHLNATAPFVLAGVAMYVVYRYSAARMFVHAETSKAARGRASCAGGV